MDPANIYWVEANPDDNNRKSDHRRNNPDGDRDTSSSSVPEMFGTNEETGDDIRRRERMAQAMYDC
jgi:hypothetical protein